MVSAAFTGIDRVQSEALVARTLSIWSMAGMMLVMLGIPSHEKNSVASLNIFFRMNRGFMLLKQGTDLQYPT